MRSRKRKPFKWLPGAVLAGVGVIVAALFVFNKTYYTFNIPDTQEITVEYGGSYTLPEVVATRRGTLLPFTKEAPVAPEGAPDLAHTGSRTIVYRAGEDDETAEAIIVVKVVDTQPPVITLHTNPEQITGIGQIYLEEGFDAADNYDGDLTAQVERTEGEGTVIYRVTDSSGNVTTVTRTIDYRDLAPTLTLEGDAQMNWEAGVAFEDPGCRAVDDVDGDISGKVLCDTAVDPFAPGEYLLTYTITDSAGNNASVSRTVTVADTTPPEITLVDTGATTNPGKTYEEEGYSAYDSFEGDLTEAVLREDDGTYVTYTVSDSAGNTAVATREIRYLDTTPPVITLSGGAVYLSPGDAYSEPGFSAWDDLDGTITWKVSVSSNVNTAQIGVYTVKYFVKDRAGNEAYATRTVFVYTPQSQGATVDPGDKVVYLTFDDGPGAATEHLLDILDKYNVKVTFFVTGQYSGYAYMIGEEARRGHTVAMHTYSHNYNQIYASEEAYFADLQMVSDLVYQNAGIRPTILRFPGGTSNTVSRFNPGIMTRLVEAVTQMGYQYCDWNVSSGDAGGLSTEQIYNNVINGISGRSRSVVLQHDIKWNSVEAVEAIIVWCLANGYTLLPMDSTTPMVHHRVNN